MTRVGGWLAAASLTALLLATASAAETGNGPIVYASYAAGFALFQINPDGSGRTAIAGEGITDPTLSPDGTQIAYLGKSATAGANRDLFVMRADGCARRLLASYPQFDPVGASLSSLAWSPDGTKIAYLLPVTSGEPLRIVDVASGAQVPVTADGTRKAQLAWSPDGTEIAFVVSGPQGTSGIDVKKLATGAVRTLSPSPGAASPRWSPDGTRIAYVDHNGGEWVVARGGGNIRRIDIPVLTPEYPSAPVWSLDGRTIFFSKVVSFGPYVHGYPTDRYSLFAAKADGTGQTVVRDGVTPLGWSPAGDALVVARAGSTASPVYFVRPDGQCLTFVTQGRFVGWRRGTATPPAIECVDLTLRATAPKTSGRAGETFRLTVGNVGTQPAAPSVVQVFDQVVTPLAYDRRACTFSRDAVRCRLVSLDPGRETSLCVTVRAQPGVLRSTIDVSYPGHDADPFSNERSTRTRVDACWLLGTRGPDRLHGTSRGELICGLQGDDHIYPRGGNDVVRAGAGEDVIDTAGGGRDVIDCGSGYDLVVADAGDRVFRNCERVVRTRG